METTTKTTQADSGSDEACDEDEGAVGGVVERIVTQEVHYHIKGNVYHGDIVWTKADVKDSAIESIGGTESKAEVMPTLALIEAGTPDRTQVPEEIMDAVSALTPLGSSSAQPAGLPALTSPGALVALQVPAEASIGVAGASANDTGSEAHVGLPVTEVAQARPNLTQLRERLTTFSLAEREQENQATRPKTVEVGMTRTGSTSTDTKGERRQTDLFETAASSQLPEIEDEILSTITSLAEEAAEKYVGRHLPLKLVKTYEDEDRKISMNFMAKYEDLILPLRQIWARVKREASIAALGRHVANMSPEVAGSSSASLCYEITKRHSNSEDEDEAFLLPYNSRVQDVFKMGKEFASDNLFVHAVISFYFCAKLHRINSKGEDSVDGMLSCVHKIRQAIRSAEEEESTNPFPEWAMGFRESTNMIVQDCLSLLLQEISPVSQPDASSPD